MNMIRILLVDDDSTCLAIISAILKKWKYEVTTTKHGEEALSMLSMPRRYDLVLADVHMPYMNGFQLHDRIKKKFNLPLVFISADDREDVVRNGMANGATHFLVKPFKCDDLRNLWQFTVWWQKFKNPIILLKMGQINRDQYDSLIPTDRRRVRRRQNNKNNGAGHGATSSTTTAAIDPAGAPRASRTRKLVWTNTLHNRFVEAILIIGYHKAVPATILEVMNVPGLTREQVASHLQKYRKFLLRVLDNKTDIKCSDWIDFKYYSSHVSGNPNLLLIEQLRNENVEGDLAKLTQQLDNNVPVLGTSSSILNSSASTTELTPSAFKALPPFTKGSSTIGTKNAMNEMLMQQTPISTQGNTLVFGCTSTTNDGCLSNVVAGDLDGVTFPYLSDGHIGSSSSAPTVGQNLYCSDVSNTHINNHKQSSARQHNFFSGGLSESYNVFTSMNHSAPSIVPLSTSFYSQQPFNADVLSNTFLGGINIQSFGDENPSSNSTFGANQCGVSLPVNEQVDDIGSITLAPADNYLPVFNPNLNHIPNQDENEEGENSFWADIVDVHYREFGQVNDDGQNHANHSAHMANDVGEEKL